MCGIIGYVGEKLAVPILLDGLKKLVYRGYDSSGIGVVTPKNGEIVVCKTQGKIQNLQNLLKNHPLPSGVVGISHTRWATHGAPNHVNSHPHFSSSKKILVVHNGIIENYETLKEQLVKKGHQAIAGGIRFRCHLQRLSRYFDCGPCRLAADYRCGEK